MTDAVMLGVFARQPVPGACKTRLAAAIGEDWAARLADAFLRDTVERFGNICHTRCLAYTPATAAARTFFEGVGGERYALWPQPETSLGDRLAGFILNSLTPGRRVVIIGTDSPTLPIDYVQQAIALLEDRDCVLGPATDGGFYLIGLRRWEPGLLDGVAWSSSRVLEQVIEQLERFRLTLSVLPPWYDIDTWDDLCLLQGHVAGLRLAGQLGDVPRTVDLLHKLSSMSTVDVRGKI